MENSIGNLILRYRKKKGLSQFELEIEIDASPGSLSRIEHGLTNPSKETLHKIADALKLTKDEKTKLFGLVNTTLTEEDILSARKSIQDYLGRSDVLAMLIDDRGFIIDASPSLINMIGIPEAEVMNYLGKNLLEIQGDPKLGIWSMLENPEELLVNEIVLFIHRMKGREDESWYKDLIKKLYKIEGFKTAFEKAKKIPLTHFPKDARVIKIKSESGIVTLFSHFTKLESDPRFELIDYIIKD